MATVVELARQANVPLENVLRVLNGEPVSTDVAERVNQAIELLGPPAVRARRVPDGNGNLPVPAGPPANGGHELLLDALAQARAEAASASPEEMSSVVYEAVRIEVRPLAERVNAFFDQLVGELALVRGQTEAERRERLEDIELLVELIRAGWLNVDRRLGRIERILERLQAERSNGG